MKLRHLLFGAIFGFVLSRAGATDPAAISAMFTLVDPHLIGVIATAIAATAAGFLWIRRTGAMSRSGAAIALTPKPVAKGMLLGALVFGAGWALSGTCPGTALAQIGEGRLSALFTFAGILAGAHLATPRFSATR